MKSITIAIASLFFVFIVTNPSLAQRSIGAKSLVLDDGSGQTITLQTPASGWTGNIPFVIPIPPAGNPPSGFVYTGTAAGQILQWVAPNTTGPAPNFYAGGVQGSWQPVPISAIGAVTGTGTAGIIPIWTGASSQGTSAIADDGSTVSVTNGEALLFSGTTGTTPASGVGTRLEWIPAKEAFRAGSVDATEWDDANVGTNSFAVGANTTASNNNAFAAGYGATASGNNSTAFGSGSLASGDASTAIGWVTVASNQGTLATGIGSTASGQVSTALGYYTTASGFTAIAMGYQTTASGNYATVSGGASNIASGGSATVSGGASNTASSSFATVSGGFSNTASANSSTVSGGVVNTAGGDYAAIPGGEHLTLSGYDDFGFLSGNDNSGNYAMSIAANNTSVFGNTDLWLANNDNTARALYFYAPYNTAGAFPNGDNYVAFKAGAVTTSVIWTLPLADATSASQALTSNAAGTLSWSTVPLGSGASGIVPLWTGTTTLSTSAIADDGSTVSVTNGEALLFSGTTGTTPASGAGTRLEWIPAKEAFRAGSVDATEWDDANVGTNSFAVGANTTASNNNAFAAGYGATASGNNSTAFGSGSLASGDASTAIGWVTVASNQGTLATGIGSTASGQVSTAMGYQTTASGYASIAMGYHSTASSTLATVSGGSTNIANSYAATVSGGATNTAGFGNYATVSGGSTNTASGGSATVSGGANNISSNAFTTVSGGFSNTASANSSTVSGGVVNTAGGDYAAIPGGEHLTLSGYDDFGFLSGNDNSGNYAMSIAANNTSVFGNTDLWLANNDNTARALYFYAPYNTAGAFPNGDNYVGFKAGAVTTSVIWTLPLADGTSGQTLTTNGSGTLSWATAGGGGSIVSVSSTSTVGAGVSEVVCSGTSNITVTLPAASSYASGTEIDFIWNGNATNTATIQAGGTDALVLGTGATATIQTEASGWNSLGVKSDGTSMWYYCHQ